MTNTITITGRLARDPELRFGQSGVAMTTVTVPDQKRKKNDRGEWEDASATTWFKATVFREAAEELAERARKGDTVVITGRLITREWEGKQGDTQSSLEVDNATVAVVPGSKPANRQPAPQSDPWATQPAGGGDRGYDDSPPF